MASASASPNAVTPGPVGVVAAAGTGAQEAMALLDRWGVGVSQVIGVGGRDLSAEVGGRMARSAISALREDPATEVILFVSKPPAPEVAAAVLASAGETPLVAALIGLDPEFPAPPGSSSPTPWSPAWSPRCGVLGLDRARHDRDARPVGGARRARGWRPVAG